MINCLRKKYKIKREIIRLGKALREWEKILYKKTPEGYCLVTPDGNKLGNLYNLARKQQELLRQK